jgi:hypothetical protein
MMRTLALGISSLLLCCLSQTARAATLTTCGGCDGDKFALVWQLDSDNGTNSVFEVTLLADLSGNNLGTAFRMDAVAIGFNLPAGATLDTAMEFAPNGGANWTAQGGGLSAGGCNGHGAFICASANAATFAALAQDAASATTPYEWTFRINVPDSTPDGAASIFSGSHLVKVHYSDVQGHLGSGDFSFADEITPHDVLPTPEPISLALVGTGLISLCFLRRRTVS